MNPLDRSPIRSMAVLLAVVVGAMTAGGCRRDEEVGHVTVAKAPPMAPAAMPPAMGGSNLPPGHPPMGGGMVGGAAGGPAAVPGMVGDVPPPPAVEAGSGLKWKLPPGWTEARTGGMRYATIKPGADSPIEISVVVLGGAAGGELANVNRWRGQVGLGPVDDAALAALRKEVVSKAGKLALFDFAGDGASKSRMIAGVLNAEGKTWFVKLVGEAGAVGAVSGAFTKFLETLSFE